MPLPLPLPLRAMVTRLNEPPPQLVLRVGFGLLLVLFLCPTT